MCLPSMAMRSALPQTITVNVRAMCLATYKKLLTKDERAGSLAVVSLVCLLTIVSTMVEMSSTVRGRDESSLTSLVGVRLVFPDAPLEVLASGAPVTERDASTVVTISGMSAVVTV